MDEKKLKVVERLIHGWMPPHDPALEPYFLEVEDRARRKLAEVAAVSGRESDAGRTAGGAARERGAGTDPCEGMPFPPLLACCVRLRVVLDHSYLEIARLLRLSVFDVLEMIAHAAACYTAYRENPNSRAILAVLLSDRQERKWQ